VPPERKLAFLKLAFDKLDPNLIQQALVRHNWSVDGALDDILKAEEERCRILELKKYELYQGLRPLAHFCYNRQKEEEERKRRELEQLKMLEQQRQLSEQRNKVTFMQGMFPNLSEQFIAQQLQAHNWNPDAAFGVLEANEAKIRQDLEAARLEQQRRAQWEAEQRRQAEVRASFVLLKGGG